MHEFQGQLLIGGLRLERVRCELEEEVEQPGSQSWRLAGHLHLLPEQLELLEFDRQYLLQLEDGRSGPVVVSRIARARENDVTVDFHSRK